MWGENEVFSVRSQLYGNSHSTCSPHNVAGRKSSPLYTSSLTKVPSSFCCFGVLSIILRLIWRGSFRCVLLIVHIVKWIKLSLFSLRLASVCLCGCARVVFISALIKSAPEECNNGASVTQLRAIGFGTWWKSFRKLFNLSLGEHKYNIFFIECVSWTKTWICNVMQCDRCHSNTLRS